MAKREVTVDEAKAAVGELVFYFQVRCRSYHCLEKSEKSVTSSRAYVPRTKQQKWRKCRKIASAAPSAAE